MAGDERHLHILRDRHRGEGRGDLERSPDAEAPDVAGRQAGGALAEDRDAAGRRRELAVDHGEAGALARAVRPDERKDLARFEREAHVAHRLEAGIGLAELLRDENAHELSPRRRDGARALRQASKLADKALREQDDEQDDERAEDELGIIGVADHPDRQRPIDRRADDAARHRADAAEQDHDEPVDRQRNRDVVGKHAALEKGVERPGQRRESAGDHEAHPLHAPAHDADRLRAQRRVAQRPQRIAEGREGDDAQERDRARAQGERQPVEARGRGRPGARPDADDAVVAARHVGPLIGDRPGDLGEGKRQHGEIDAGEAHAEPAEDERAGEAQKHSSGDRRLHAEPERLQRDRRAVGAEAEIGGVTEGGEPAVREQKMQARRIEHEDQHFRRDAKDIIARDERQKRRRPPRRGRRAAGLARRKGASGKRPRRPRSARPPPRARAAPRAARSARSPSPGRRGRSRSSERPGCRRR